MPGLPLLFFPLFSLSYSFLSSSHFFRREAGEAPVCINASQEHRVPLLLSDGPGLLTRLLSALFSVSDTCAIAMKRTEEREKKEIMKTNLVQNCQYIEMKGKQSIKMGCFFFSNNNAHGDNSSSSMIFLFYNLTPYCLLFKLCQWLCCRVILWLQYTMNHCINCRPHYEF